MMLLTFAPLFLLGAVWCFYRSDGASLVWWRRVCFVAAFVSSTVTAAVLGGFTVHAYLIQHGAKFVDLDRAYPIFSMMGLGLFGAVLAVSGRRASRALLICDGIFTFVLWYLVALAASP